MVHLAAEQLSALLDGELAAAEEAAVRSHLAACARCAADLATFSRLDAALGAPPPLDCHSGRDLRSALLDRELTAPEARIARAHLASCADCAAEQARWSGLELALSQLPPATPSAATDAAMVRLTGQPARRGPLATPGLTALRGAAAAAVAFALIVAMLPGAPSVPDAARNAAPGAFAFASLSAQSVLHSASNTLYVLRTAAGAVDAVDARSFALRIRIPVGGKPTALALIESTDRLMVLDAGAKTVTEIDVSRNVVVAVEPVNVGRYTPTGFAVDQKNGTVIVTSKLPPAADTTAAAPPQPSPATQVTVIDPATREQTVHALQVPTNEVVPGPQGLQALLVSSEATTLVDSAYQPINTYPGGLSAVFAPSGQQFAILGAVDGATRLVFGGEVAAAPLRIEGTPAALAALPDGRYAVLVRTSATGGELHIVDAAGALLSSVQVGVVGPDLEYDAAEKRFTIAGGGEVASVPLPAAAIAQPQPNASSAPRASPDPSATPEPSATPAPSATPEPSRGPAASPAPAGREVVAVPADAREVVAGLYYVSLDGGAPRVTATTDTHLWFVDSDNALGALELRSGVIFRFARLPADASVVSIGVGPEYVYAADAAGRRLFLFDRKSEQLSHVTIPAPVSAMTVSSGGIAWFAVPNTSQLLSFTPLTKKFHSVDLGVGAIVALAPQQGGGVWFSTARGLGSYDPAHRLVTLLPWAASGTAHVLLPGRRGTLWVGTVTGEVHQVRNGLAVLAAKLDRPVTALALDPRGQPWYVAAASGTGGGMTYRPVDGSRPAATVPGAAFGLAFTSTWRAWLPEYSGGFYLGIEEPR